MKEIITLPWQGGEVVLSHSVPAFPPVETAPTIRVKLTEYHRRPERKVLLILGVRLLLFLARQIFGARGNHCL